MSMLNRSKIRSDVLKLMDKSLKIQTMGVFKFLKLDENKGKNLQDYMKKIAKENKKFFDKWSTGEISIEDLYGIMSKEETTFLAKMIRYAVDYSIDVELKNHPISEEIKVEKINIDEVPAEWQFVPEAVEDRVLLYFHGGGFVLGNPKMHRLLTIELGKVTKMRVLSVDYRLAPENPYPAGLEDCLKSYKWLLSNGIKPENIVIGGDSAGGNFALVTLLKLRDEGITLPRGAVLLSPFTDCTSDSKTIYKNAETDPILADIGVFWWTPAYLAGADPYDPYVSPVLADLQKLPPLLVQASTAEMLYDHSTRIVEQAKTASVDATFQKWDDMIHVWQGFGLFDLPEAREAIDKIGEFVQKLFE